MVHLVFCWFLVDNLINSQLKGIIQHPGDQFAQQITRTLNTGIFVNLNQPHLLIIADEKIQPKELKAITSLIEVDFLLNRGERHVRDLLDLVPDFRHLLIGHVLIQGLERELVSVLELSVVDSVLLDGVVCQVDEVVADVVGGVDLG